MSKEFNLNVDKRDLTNKGGRKRALKEGKIPGVYYSHDSKESLSFYIEKSELGHAQKADTQIFNIQSMIHNFPTFLQNKPVDVKYWVLMNHL